LAQDLDLAKLESMIEEVSLDQAIEKAHALMAGQVRGRVVVRI
jgi:acrylyl-CoA reductase (NADPH)